MKFLIIVGALVCAAQAKTNVCEVGNPSGKCAPTQPYCSKGYECIDGDCCQAKERLCPHNQRSHGLCDDNGQCPDPGHQCYTTDDDQRVCCNKNQPTTKKQDCLSGKSCESSEDCQISYACVEGSCCKNSDSCPMGYINNYVLGCYIIMKESDNVNYDYATQRCANNGGALPLLNSKEEVDALSKIILVEDFTITPIQGSRSTGSSVWITDDGSPLPYHLPIYYEIRPSFTALQFTTTMLGPGFVAVDPFERKFVYYVCEIKN